MVKSINAKWNPLIEIPKSIPSVAFFADEEFLREYNAKVDADFNGNHNLKIFRYKDGVVEGSNSFVNALVGNMVKPLGVNIVTPAQLEQVLATNALPLRGQYIDTGLVLRSENGTNEYLAKNLAKQVKARGMKLKNPVVILLTGVEVINDRDSDYGLAFKLMDDAELIEAPQLDSKNHGKSFSRTDEKGLPIFDKNGNRNLYTNDTGLCRLSLYRDSCLYSNSGYLANSDESGRVVLVRGEADAQNFSVDNYVAKLTEEKQKQIAETKDRFQKALALLQAK